MSLSADTLALLDDMLARGCPPCDLCGCLCDPDGPGGVCVCDLACRFCYVAQQRPDFRPPAGGYRFPPPGFATRSRPTLRGTTLLILAWPSPLSDGITTTHGFGFRSRSRPPREGWSAPRAAR